MSEDAEEQPARLSTVLYPPDSNHTAEDILKGLQEALDKEQDVTLIVEELRGQFRTYTNDMDYEGESIRLAAAIKSFILDTTEQHLANHGQEIPPEFFLCAFLALLSEEMDLDLQAMGKAQAYLAYKGVQPMILPVPIPMEEADSESEDLDEEEPSQDSISD